MLDCADDGVDTARAGGDSSPFWRESMKQCLRHAVPVIYSAHGRVTVADVINFVSSAAEKYEQYADPAFRERSFAARTMAKLLTAPAVPLPESEAGTLLSFWFDQFTAIDPKTRSNITITLTAKLDPLKHGLLRSCLCDRTTIVPEMTFHGAIILLCIPILQYKEEAVTFQKIFKYCWQRAVEARNALGPGQSERPVALIADEAQYVITDRDHSFSSTCRSSRAGIVYLSQSLPTYFAKLGHGKESAVEGLVNKLNTQIFHLNSCYKTNKYASDLIGRDLQWRATQGRSVGTNRSRGMNEGTSANRGQNDSHGASAGPGGASWSHGRNEGSGSNWGANVGTGTNESESWSEAQQMDNVIESGFLASELLSGGPQNNRIVSAVWFRAGARFAANNGRNWLLVRFRQ